LPLGGCGVGCSFSVGVIPGWTDTGATGQFQPGSSSGNFAYFNYIPGGVTVAYSNGGSIYQTVGATAVAGDTYTLTVDVGLRTDGYDLLPTEDLIVNGNAVAATGPRPPSVSGRPGPRPTRRRPPTRARRSRSISIRAALRATGTTSP